MNETASVIKNMPQITRNLLFNLISQGKRSFLGIIFDHRLLEARGAEAFLDLLGGESGLSLRGSLYEPSHLNKWLDKFRAGREINRVFLNLTEGRSTALRSI